MTDHTRVAVIGGGVVGASCLYHLALRGWRDVMLFERDELTSGSTWHAAGNVPTYATSWSLLKLQNYSAQLYRGLAEAVGCPITYHVVGALRLAHTAARIDEFHHISAMARANGMAFEVLPPTGIAERHPFVKLDDLLGALWDPYDGDIDPAQLTQAFAKGARDLGARVRRFERVVGLAQRADGGWHVRTDKGEILADVVVNAAGYRAGEVMALIGRTLPSVAMSHQYLVTEAIAEIADHPRRLPLMRDPDVSYYLRQERDGFILGPYEQQATAMWPEGIPEDFAFQLWDDDLARLEPIIAAAIERVPLLGKVGIRRVINGPIPYSPDGNPYIGPEHGLQNFFHCNTFSFGIAQAGGAGKCLAEWVIDGQPEWDLWPLDRRRFTGTADRRFATARAIEIYQNEYAPSFPHEERMAGRPLRCSPLYNRLAARGARFGTRGAWESPLYFVQHAEDDKPALSFRRARRWMPHVASEVACVRERVGLSDMTGLTMLEVAGPEAAARLDRLLCTRLPAVGQVRLGYALTPTGRLLSEFTVTRCADDRFILMSAASAEWHDEDVLGEPVRNMGDAFCTLAIGGPRSGEVLSAVTDADLSERGFPGMTAKEIEVAGCPVLALRISSYSALGWELHAPRASLPVLYDALMRAGVMFGIGDVGAYAVDGLRLERCHPGWKSGIETAYTPFEVGLGGLVDLAKGEFVGRTALLAARGREPESLLVQLRLDDGDADALPCTPVLLGDDRVGLVTGGGWSHTRGASIALAAIRSDLAVAGTALTLDLLGMRRRATVGAVSGG